MARKKFDADIHVHKKWLNLLQPVGLVVSPPALKKAQAAPSSNVGPEQRQLVRLALPHLDDDVTRLNSELVEGACIKHFPTFACDVLGWREADFVAPPPEFTVPVLDHDDVLRPTWGVKNDDGTWLLLIREEAPFHKDLDVVHEVHGQEWEATPQARFERLLRETKVPIGILTNGGQLRLVYAPAGESSGHLTFPVAGMCLSAGSAMLSALLMLLGAPTLWNKPEKERLPFILKESRKYQADVTTRLADQVLDALRELLNGFQSAHTASGQRLLAELQTSRTGRQEIYGGLLASILRCIFVLYAEDRGLMPQHDTYLRGYAITRLFEKLREDAAMHPDTMDQRFGAWTQLLALFRFIFDGGEHGALSMPAREGKLFDPDTYPFLEGRGHNNQRVLGALEHPPRISDGVVYRVLRGLLILDGERLSYRALDVEQIGSVYEALMGFDLEVATGASIGVKPKHVVVDLDAVLAAKGAARDELLKAAEVKAVPKEVKTAKTIDDLVAALDKVLSPRTPGVIPMGAMFLQPGAERRRSGSHYTPRALTEPIVATTLRPIFEQLGPRPKPKDILALKVCDPAMGSGAFLVEACRQLADKLVDAWNHHPTDKPNFKGEEMVLRARREVAQRCLYGVDKNPFAVDLAKLSLWLATLAKDHPFTFLDHALKCGDSLVGLTKEQIIDMAWPGAEPKQLSLTRQFVEERMKQAIEDRAGIFALGDSDDVHQKQRYLKDAEAALEDVRLIGDAVIAAFFAGDNDKQRKAKLELAHGRAVSFLVEREESGAIADLSTPNQQSAEAAATFHWHIEFPEAFKSEDKGFDVVIGNPPFMGGRKISSSFGEQYQQLLSTLTPNAGNTCDLVGYFFRSAFNLIKEGGSFGLLATNTISQGDTRTGGLAEIIKAGGVIYEAKKRISWPGAAAVVVSSVHVFKPRSGLSISRVQLDGLDVSRISCFLFPGEGNSNPERLLENAPLFTQGSKIYGQGFLFDDFDEKASPVQAMRDLIAQHPECASRILPYLGGEEINSDPEHRHSRYVISLSDLSSEEIVEQRWAPLLSIVRAKVKPYRDTLGPNKVNDPLKRKWWAFQAHRPEFYRAISKMNQIIGLCRVSGHIAPTLLPSNCIYSESLVLFSMDSFAAFTILQCRAHDAWARLFSSTLGDAIRYAPSDCFETFPLPINWSSNARLNDIGSKYLSLRKTIMLKANEGLTKTYNRFHDPDEHDPDILELRGLRDEMDRAVLDAYGWSDITPVCTFLLDYEEEEDDDDGGKRKKKKPWRYRWPDDVRDDVLARLMKLNAERYAEEQRIGADKQLVDAAVATEEKAKKKAAKKKQKADDDAPNLFPEPQDKP